MVRKRGSRSVPSPERREQILTAAYELFTRAGYDTVSMSGVAEAVGVTKPIVYRLFGSKEALYMACSEQFVDPMVEEVRAAAMAEPTADRQLWRGIRAQLEFIQSHEAAWRVFVSDAARRGAASHDALVAGRGKIVTMLADLIEHALRSEGAPPLARHELFALAHGLQGTVERYADWWEGKPTESVDAVTLRAMNLAWNGFGGMLAGSWWVPDE